MDSRGEVESEVSGERVRVGAVPAVAGPIRTRGTRGPFGPFGAARGVALLGLLVLAEVYLAAVRVRSGDLRCPG